jgi:hypothetical protein
MNYQNKIYEDLKCIWMSSNVVDYKLCDRNFDCDNCNFHSAMMNSSHHLSNNMNVNDTRVEKIIHKLINDLGKEELKKDCIYLTNHLMVKNLFSNTYYIGFSPLANYLLDNCNSVDHYYNDEKVSKGKPLIKISGDWGSIDIASPVCFTFLGRISKQEIMQNSDKWFGLIECSEEEFVSTSITGENYMKDILGVTRELTKVRLNYPDVGTTMMDGGTEVNFLYQIIGIEKYINILKKLFYKTGDNK